MHSAVHTAMCVIYSDTLHRLLILGDLGNVFDSIRDYQL